MMAGWLVTWFVCFVPPSRAATGRRHENKRETMEWLESGVRTCNSTLYGGVREARIQSLFSLFLSRQVIEVIWLID